MDLASASSARLGACYQGKTLYKFISLHVDGSLACSTHAASIHCVLSYYLIKYRYLYHLVFKPPSDNRVSVNFQSRPGVWILKGILRGDAFFNNVEFLCPLFTNNIPVACKYLKNIQKPFLWIIWSNKRLAVPAEHKLSSNSGCPKSANKAAKNQTPFWQFATCPARTDPLWRSAKQPYFWPTKGGSLFERQGILKRSTQTAKYSQVGFLVMLEFKQI